MMLLDLLRDDEGTTIVEYALITSLFGVAMISALAAITQASSDQYGTMTTGLTGIALSPP